MSSVIDRPGIPIKIGPYECTWLPPLPEEMVDEPPEPELTEEERAAQAVYDGEEWAICEAHLRAREWAWTCDQVYGPGRRAQVSGRYRW